MRNRAKHRLVLCPIRLCLFIPSWHGRVEVSEASPPSDALDTLLSFDRLWIESADAVNVPVSGLPFFSVDVIHQRLGLGKNASVSPRFFGLHRAALFDCGRYDGLGTVEQLAPLLPHLLPLWHCHNQ